MTHAEALDVLAACRARHLVITTHGSVDAWVSLSDTPLDFAYVPASMGQGPALGLGLALAQARHGVVVVCGDGHLLMNLGCLITLADHPADVFLIVIDNGVYEVTGGQPIPGAGRIDFPGLARAAGIRRVYSCPTLGAWRAVAAEALAGPGTVVICLDVEARPGQKAPIAMRPMAQQIARLRAALRDEGGAHTPDGLSAPPVQTSATPPGPITLRTGLQPGDLGHLVSLHGLVYARERGFDPSFEAYVAGPLSEFVRSANERQRLWIAERDGRIIGCIAIVAAAPRTAQLRWFLVDPRARGAGLGKRLLAEAVDFSRECGYAQVMLWTESALTAAAHLYRAAGFRMLKHTQRAAQAGSKSGVEIQYQEKEIAGKPSRLITVRSDEPGKDQKGKAGPQAYLLSALDGQTVLACMLPKTAQAEQAVVKFTKQADRSLGTNATLQKTRRLLPDALQVEVFLDLQAFGILGRSVSQETAVSRVAPLGFAMRTLPAGLESQFVIPFDALKSVVDASKAKQEKQ
jgi:N-acetylglutamate synthase-like GNAT family acetyltransferase